LILCVPIAGGVAQFLQIDSALMAATIVSGVICGYQMSVAFGSITHYEKVKEIFWLITPAAFFTLILLSMYQYYVPEPLFFKALQLSLCLQDYISMLPIVIFFIAALLHLDLIINLVMVSSFSIILGMLQHKISNVDAIMLIFQGYYAQKEMVQLMILFIFLSGLINIINYNHGFHYIVDTIKHKIKSMYIRQLTIVLIIMIINCVIGLDILSENILMPMMKKISDRYAISYQKTLAFLHVITTTTCCLLPYAPIILLASYLSHTSCTQIIGYMFYSYIVCVWMVASIFISKYQKISKKYFYRSGH
jgi:Na+/H+ antiporter NhaC